MSVLEHKIDFAVLVTAANANPNGDPLNGNRPRENYDSCGEISDVCIKRKIRNRLQDMGENVYVQSKDHARTDDFTNLSDRHCHIMIVKLCSKALIQILCNCSPYIRITCIFHISM